MRLGQFIELVGGRALNEFNHTRQVEFGFETALLSDVPAHAKPYTTLIVTEITHPQVVRTAERVDAAGVLFVKNKMPDGGPPSAATTLDCCVNFLCSVSIGAWSIAGRSNLIRVPSRRSSVACRFRDRTPSRISCAHLARLPREAGGALVD